MPPPHPSLLLFNGELIGHHEILTHIEYLSEHEMVKYEAKKECIKEDVRVDVLV